MRHRAPEKGGYKISRKFGAQAGEGGFDKISRRIGGRKETKTFFSRASGANSLQFCQKIRVFFSNFLPRATRAKKVLFRVFRPGMQFFSHFLGTLCNGSVLFFVTFRLRIRVSPHFPRWYVQKKSHTYPLLLFVFCLWLLLSFWFFQFYSLVYILLLFDFLSVWFAVCVDFIVCIVLVLLCVSVCFYLIVWVCFVLFHFVPFVYMFICFVIALFSFHIILILGFRFCFFVFVLGSFASCFLFSLRRFAPKKGEQKRFLALRAEKVPKNLSLRFAPRNRKKNGRKQFLRRVAPKSKKKS